ncbi:TspO/MBR family protein [Sphingomonas sp. ASV193]|uniref:TspO/MBR family protein n=1 Tax=Sphingomonas sp. ASV193 TaxID=3144405 RepID=UPI0032E87A6B
MATIAPRSDRGIWKKALVTVPALVVAGSLFAFVARSGFDNPWYAALKMPSFQPPGWVFGAVWTTLYTLMGLSLASLLNEPSSKQRTTALALFGVQMLLNLAWSPVFFSGHYIDAAFLIILAMDVLVTMTIVAAYKVRPLAGALLLPYLAWLCLATALNHETGRLNPGADAAPLGLTKG